MINAKMKILLLSLITLQPPESKTKRLNFSRLVKIQSSKLIDGNFIMFPVYYTKKDNDQGYFEGLLINENKINCIDSLFKLNNIDDLDLKSFSFRLRISIFF